VSNYLHDRVEEGDTLSIGPPCGQFTLDPALVTGRAIALVSGGIGITPLMAMLKCLAHHRVATPIYFIHAARNSRHHAFAHEARKIAADCPNIRLHFRYDEPLANDLGCRHCDSTGRIDGQLLSELLPSIETEFYFCGPKPFMAGLLHTLKTLGVADSRIHYEFFGPKQELAPVTTTLVRTPRRSLAAANIA
jgi:nitric oxide dioxygenase